MKHGWRFAAERKAVRRNWSLHRLQRRHVMCMAEIRAHSGWHTRAGVLEAAKKTGVKVVMSPIIEAANRRLGAGCAMAFFFWAGSEKPGCCVSRCSRQTPEPTNDLRFLCHVEERYDASVDGFARMENLQPA